MALLVYCAPLTSSSHSVSYITFYFRSGELTISLTSLATNQTSSYVGAAINKPELSILFKVHEISWHDSSAELHESSKDFPATCLRERFDGYNFYVTDEEMY